MLKKIFSSFSPTNTTFFNLATAFFQLTGINRSNQITGSVFNTIFLTVRSCVCPTRSCKLIAGCSLWTGGPFISLFLPSFPPFQAAPSFWWFIPPPPLQKKPPACRRRFLAVYSSNLMLSVPSGFLQNRTLKPQSKPKWFIAKAKQSQRSSTMQGFSYEKTQKDSAVGELRAALGTLSWLTSDLRVHPPVFQPLSTSNQWTLRENPITEQDMTSSGERSIIS